MSAQLGFAKPNGSVVAEPRKVLEALHESVDDRARMCVGSVDGKQPYEAVFAFIGPETIAPVSGSERDDAVGKVGEVPESRAGRGEVPVNDSDDAVAVEDQVVGREVVMADHFVRFVCGSPPRTIEFETFGRVMDPPKQSCRGLQRCQAPHPCGHRVGRHDALYKGEDLSSVFREAPRLRDSGNTCRVEVGQDAVHGRSPVARLANHRVAHSDNQSHVAAAQSLFLAAHSNTVDIGDRRRTRGHPLTPRSGWSLGSHVRLVKVTLPCLSVFSW